MPGRGFCPALVTVENPPSKNWRRGQESWPRREPSMCNFLVDAALPAKYQANRHVENVTRADIKRRRRARVKTAADRNICRATAYAGISLLNSLLAGNLPLAK